MADPYADAPDYADDPPDPRLAPAGGSAAEGRLEGVLAQAVGCALVR
jgi:hypothetical protein